MESPYVERDISRRRRCLLTVKEMLRDALRLIRSKRRSALRENAKIVRRVYGYTSRRGKRKKSPTKAVVDSIPKIGRSPGVPGEGDQTDS
jgi:hypothetical protein